MSPDRSATKVGSLLRVLAARLTARADELDRAEVDRLTELANRLGTSELDLDEYVHDLASSAASDINNSGLAGQIAYLVREAGPAETDRLIREAVQDLDYEPDGCEHDTAAGAKAGATGHDPDLRARRRQ